MSISSFYETVLFQDAAFPLKISHVELAAQGRELSTGEVLPHWHEHMEFHWFEKGGSKVLTGSEWITVEDGDVTMVNPSELHTLLPGECPSSYWFFIISPQLLGGDDADAYGRFWKSLATQQTRFQHLIRHDPLVIQLIAAMVAEYQAMEPGYELAIRGHLFQLMARLYRAHRQPLPTAPSRKRQDQRLKEVLQHIGEQYAQPLSPQSLADSCGLNLSYFCRLFRQGTGMTAAAYITAYRLSKAEELLTSTDLSVTDIAARVGFSDMAYFSRRFKRQYGLSPLQFRQQTVEKPPITTGG